MSTRYRAKGVYPTNSENQPGAGTIETTSAQNGAVYGYT